MSYVETAVKWRHGTLAFYVLLVLFGAIALTTLPMELQPGGDIPQITITTAYPGAGPTEVEDLITRPLEDVLEEIEAIKEMTSASASGSSTITMEFNWGTDVKAKLVEVINKVNQSQALPEEASEPDIQIAAGAAGSNAVMWLVLTEAKDTGDRADPDYYRDLVEEEIIPDLRRGEGTSGLSASRAYAHLLSGLSASRAYAHLLRCSATPSTPNSVRCPCRVRPCPAESWAFMASVKIYPRTILSTPEVPTSLIQSGAPSSTPNPLRPGIFEPRS